MDNAIVLKLNIAKTLDELMKLIDEKVANKDDEYVVEFKKKLTEMQDNLGEE